MITSELAAFYFGSLRSQMVSVLLDWESTTNDYQSVEKLLRQTDVILGRLIPEINDFSRYDEIHGAHEVNTDCMHEPNNAFHCNNCYGKGYKK